MPNSVSMASNSLRSTENVEFTVPDRNGGGGGGGGGDGMGGMWECVGQLVVVAVAL